MTEDASTELELLAPEDGWMDPFETALAERIYTAIQDGSRWSERGLQSAEYRLGVSDLGYCSERARRMLNRQEPDEDVDLLKAALGTWIGDGVEGSISRSDLFPDAIVQASVEVTLRGERNTYTLPGHPDIILPADGILLDGKSAYKLALARRTGMVDQQKKFQRHCYGAGAWEAGLFGDIPFDQVRVGNVWIDRAGIEQGLHVKVEPLSTEVLDEAARWLDEVVYTHLMNQSLPIDQQQEAQKEPAREVCAVTCGYFRSCREWQTDVTGLLEDTSVLTAVDMYVEGLAMEKRGKAMKDEAKVALEDISGSTGEYTVRWTHVNPSSYHVDRNGYDKIQVSKIKPPKPAPKRLRGKAKEIEAGE